jgi:lysyl-tRNA synthetase class 2
VDLRLIIEIDGSQHYDNAEADAARTAELERMGWHVIRFGNHDALLGLDGLAEAILAEARLARP